MEGGIKIGVFRPISRFISKTVQDKAIVTMEDYEELMCDLSNGSTFNDLDIYIQLSLSLHCVRPTY